TSPPADPHRWRAEGSDDAAAGGAAAGGELRWHTGDLRHSRGDGVREHSGRGVEGLARDVPFERVAHAMAMQDLLDGCLELREGLHRRVAQVETRLELTGDDVGSTGTGGEIRYLEAGRLEMLGSGIPFAADELGQRRCQCMYGIFRELRIGDVALDAVHGQPATQGTAPSHLDGVADRHLTRGLANQAPIDALAA